MDATDEWSFSQSNSYLSILQLIALAEEVPLINSILENRTHFSYNICKSHKFEILLQKGWTSFIDKARSLEISSSFLRLQYQTIGRPHSLCPFSVRLISNHVKFFMLLLTSNCHRKAYVSFHHHIQPRKEQYRLLQLLYPYRRY